MRRVLDGDGRFWFLPWGFQARLQARNGGREQQGSVIDQPGTHARAACCAVMRPGKGAIMKLATLGLATVLAVASSVALAQSGGGASGGSSGTGGAAASGATGSSTSGTTAGSGAGNNATTGMSNDAG